MDVGALRVASVATGDGVDADVDSGTGVATDGGTGDGTDVGSGVGAEHADKTITNSAIRVTKR